MEQSLREAGHALDMAFDGQEGWDLAQVEPYDLLLLDWMLPKMSGLDLCRRLRQAGNQTPILLLTARDAIEDRVQGLDCGADDYLVKPFALQELHARLRALLRRQPGASKNPTLQHANIHLDPASREVLRGDRPVSLTNKEFRLLEYLMRHPGQVVSREQIIAHIWDLDFSAESNVVDVYIRSLRRKLGDDEVIRTVRGAGYQLILT